jgi:hypothetical protein
LGGIIPNWVVAKQGVGFLSAASLTRARYDRSADIDRASQAVYRRAILSHEGRYWGAEDLIVSDGNKMYGEFELDAPVDLKLRSPFARAKLALGTGPASEVSGWATASVRASPVDVLAWIWDACSRSQRSDGDLEKRVEEEQAHNILIYHRFKVPGQGAEDRESLTRFVWRETSMGYCVAGMPETVKKGSGGGGGGVRIGLRSAVKLTALDGVGTRIEYLIKMNVGDGLNLRATKAFVTERLEYVSVVSSFFLGLVKLADWSEADGKDIGMAFAQAGVASSDVAKNVADLFESYAGLHEVKKQCVAQSPRHASRC